MLRAFSVAHTVGLCFLPHPSEALLGEVNAACLWGCVRVKLRFFTSRRLRCILLFGGCRQGVAFVSACILKLSGFGGMAGWFSSDSPCAGLP